MLSNTRRGFNWYNATLLKKIAFWLMLLLYPLICFSNDKNDQWSSLLTAHQKGTIHDTVYFIKAQSLAERSFNSVSLKTQLNYYQQLAWSKKQYHLYRLKYYAFLTINATLTHKEGAAIYYLQKSEEELKTVSPYIHSLNEPRLLLSIYGGNEQTNYDKRKEVFTKVWPFLKTLPLLIAEQDVPANTCINAMTILNNASRLYANLNDTRMVKEIYSIAEKTWNSLQQKPKLDKDKSRQCLYLYYQVRYTSTLLDKDVVTAKKLLDTSYSMLRSDTTINRVWARSFERALIRKYIDLFIANRQTDSSRHYMQLLAQKANKDDPGFGTAQLLYSAKVNALENNFQKAYEDLWSVYQINDSLISLKTADINNNLYSQLIAEQTQEAITQLQLQRQQRNILIAIASLITLIGIAYLIRRMRQKEKKALATIEELNRLTQIEIAALELKANLIQRKMGMELHDDIAGQLVHLCNFIDKELMQDLDNNQLTRLQSIRALAADAYQNTRNKSHEWYAQGLEEEQQSFSETVYKLATYGLPDDQYEKTIEIDDASLQKASYSMRIELLRIVQEAFVNILKHSGANKVMLYLYEEENAIITEIKDNGKGFDTTRALKRKSIGLQSLRQRVLNMNGSLNITASNAGCHLIVTLPVS